ncbi:hypothetical protein DMX12_01140, partial [Pseudomonas sp. MB-090624]
FLGHLLDRFDLEFFGVTLTTHGTSYLGLIMRLGGVYETRGDSLCGQIDGYIAPQVEISPDEKSKLSALLRRLVEKLTNAYVFNEQRHQYKIRTLQVSNFKDFVKLVPLLPAEADRLKDL